MTLMLRAVDPQTSALRNAALVAGIDGLTLACALVGETYVTLSAAIDGREVTALAPMPSLLDFWMGERVVPTELVDPEIAQIFLRDAFREHGLPSPSRVLQWLDVVGIADAAQRHAPYLRLSGGPFEVLLSCLPSDLQGGGARCLAHLPIVLTWSLGALTLAAAQWAVLAPGDVIRLPDALGKLRAGTQLLYSFCLDGDTLMTEILARDTRVNATGEASLSDLNPVTHGTDAGARLGALPVVVDFVLTQRTMTVAEVSELQVGMTLPLGCQTPYVDLMAGSVRIGRGELVRLGQGLAVEIVTLYPGTGTPEDPVSS